MKRTLLFLLIIIMHVNAKGQTSTMLNVVPPSPEAYSLTQTDFSDVNLYTGKVNYTIPIYNIKSGSFSFPIALNYSGGNGIKVGEIASSSGLGWNLSYTGVVTRTTKGLTDDAYNSDYRGYIYLPAFPDPDLPANLEIYDKYSRNIYDPEPDIYNLSVAGVSVSFYLNRNKKPMFIEKTDVKVIPIFTGYVITGFVLIEVKEIIKSLN